MVSPCSVFFWKGNLESVFKLQIHLALSLPLLSLFICRDEKRKTFCIHSSVEILLVFVRKCIWVHLEEVHYVHAAVILVISDIVSLLVVNRI